MYHNHFFFSQVALSPFDSNYFDITMCFGPLFGGFEVLNPWFLQGRARGSQIFTSGNAGMPTLSSPEMLSFPVCFFRHVQGSFPLAAKGSKCQGLLSDRFLMFIPPQIYFLSFPMSKNSGSRPTKSVTPRSC